MRHFHRLIFIRKYGHQVVKLSQCLNRAISAYQYCKITAHSSILPLLNYRSTPTECRNPRLIRESETSGNLWSDMPSADQQAGMTTKSAVKRRRRPAAMLDCWAAASGEVIWAGDLNWAVASSSGLEHRQTVRGVLIHKTLSHWQPGVILRSVIAHHALPESSVKDKIPNVSCSLSR